MSFKKLLESYQSKTLLRFSTAGSVDDGKSTLIGRLLYDSKNIFEDTIAAVAKASKGSKDQEIDFSLFTDGLRSEREQKITIDVAYRYFSTPRRSFILADTPGHEQYTRNMATGASTADVALVLIDAQNGVSAQTKRHFFILTLLGIKHIAVAINKMDCVKYSESTYSDIKSDVENFASRMEIPDLRFIPVSALCGDNIVNRSKNMPWFKGESILEYLENIYVAGDRNLIDFRLPVQGVLRPNQHFRGFMGQVASGQFKKGDELMVLPSQKKSRVKSIQTHEGSFDTAFSPQSVVIELEDQIDVSRGDMFVPVNNIPHTDSNLESMIVWMDETPMDSSRPYIMKHLTREVNCRIDQVRYRVDINTLHRTESKLLELNEIGRVAISTSKPMFFDSYQRNRATGSFILIDTITYKTVAAGVMLDRRPEEKLKNKMPTEPTKARNLYPEKGLVSLADKIERLNQNPVTLWLTGLSGAGKTTLAIHLEKQLFEMGFYCHRLDGDNVRNGLTKDLDFSDQSRKENTRRVAEAAKLFNDSGMVIIASFISPFEEDRRQAREIIGEDRFFEVHVSTPLAICEKRDKKGLYKKAREGNIASFTGITSAYEKPNNPDIEVNTDHKTIDECVKLIMAEILKRIKR